MVDIHAAGQDTEIQVINPRTEQSDFIFYTGTHPVGTRFNATIYGKDFTDVFTWQVTLYYNATLINCTNAWFTPEELALWGEFPLTYFYANSTKFGDTRQAPAPGVNVTSIELAILEFEILKSPEKYKPLSCPLNIYNVNTFLIDPEGEGISVTVTDGKYEYKYAVVNLEVKPNQHIANKLETFDVEVWLNNVTESDRVIGAQFRLKYNATLLAVKNVSEGPFFREFKSCPEEPYTQFVWYNITSRDEDPQNYDLLGPHILVSVVILSYEGQYTNFPNGSGILATVTFRGRYRGFYGALNSSLTLTDIILVDDAKNPPYGEPNVIPTIEPRNGYYEISPIQVLPMLKVQPEVYEAKKKDESFQINVTVYDLDVDAQLNSVEFKLTYNATVLEVLNTTEGPFLPSFGNTSFNYSVGSDSVTIRNHIETLFAGFPNRNGTIATIAFKAIRQGFYPEETNSTLNLTEIVLLDIYQNMIPTSDSINGFYKIFPLRRVGIPWYAVIITVLATIVIAAAIVTYYKRIRKHKSRTV